MTGNANRWTLEVDLDDGSRRKVTVTAYGPSHAKVRAEEQLAPKWRVVRVLWTRVASIAPDAPSRRSGYATRQAEREAISRPWGRVGELNQQRRPGCGI